MPFKCVICKNYRQGCGHNPEPVVPLSKGKCCDDCNQLVLKVRLGLILKENKSKKRKDLINNI